MQGNTRHQEELPLICVDEQFPTILRSGHLALLNNLTCGDTVVGRAAGILQ